MIQHKIILVFLFLIFVFTFVSGKNNSTRPVKVFLLGGQSNMDGCGKSEELPKTYKIHPDNIVTWDNEKKVWVALGEDSFAERSETWIEQVRWNHITWLMT